MARPGDNHSIIVVDDHGPNRQVLRLLNYGNQMHVGAILRQVIAEALREREAKP